MRKGERFTLFIITRKSGKVKQTTAKSKNSIFIDEKIYSVDRVKIYVRSNKATDGFTYLKVWQE